MLDRYAIVATGDLEAGLTRLTERPTAKDAVKEPPARTRSSGSATAKT